MEHKFPLTKFQRFLETFTWVLAGMTLIRTALSWNRLPKVVATHYNEYGVANDWGGRWTVFIVPIMLVFTCGIVSFCVRLGLKSINLPFQPNPEREWYVLRAIRDALCLMNLELALLFSVLQAYSLEQAQLPVLFMWGMLGVIATTVVFGIWRSWSCNQGSL